MDIIKPKNNNNEDVAIDSNYIVDEDDTLYNKLNNIESFASKCTFYESYARALFFKLGRMVSICYQGELKVHTASEIIFTIPEGYRPVGNDAQYRFNVCYNSDYFGSAFIDADGNCHAGYDSGTTSNRLYFNVCYLTDE